MQKNLLAGFNSLQVSYKLRDLRKSELGKNRFQFLIGQLQTNSYFRVRHFARVFQFLIGQLQTGLSLLKLMAGFLCFNSLQVSYKLCTSVVCIIIYSSFNSLQVSYKLTKVRKRTATEERVSIPYRLATNKCFYCLKGSRITKVSIPYRLATNSKRTTGRWTGGLVSIPYRLATNKRF